MKKVISVILLLTIALSFTGCSEKTDLILGTTNGDTYENQFLGIGMQLPSGWTFYQSSQIKQLNEISGDMTNEEMANYLRDKPLVYDMAASQAGTINSINVNFENLRTSGTTAADEAAYAQLAASQLPQVFESMGCTDITCTTSTTTLAGIDHASVETSATRAEAPLFQKQVVIQKGDYMICITVTAGEQATIDKIVSSFYSLPQE